MRKVIVAFSGGVDSTYLLQIAVETLGPDAVLACTAVSPSLARDELQSVHDIAQRAGARLRLIETREMDDPQYVENSPQRCYHCKKELYARLRAIAQAEGYDAIVNGANVDDKGDYRPGMNAAADFEVRSPLLDAGLSKAEVRELSRESGLPTWDKPALACLASRIPYGTPVTILSLGRIERGERILRQQGFRICRVRHHGTVARIEVPADRISELVAEPLRGLIASAFKEIGYTYVAVDINGFRSGSGNEVLAGKIKSA